MASSDLVPTKVGTLSVQRLGSGPAVLLWHSMLVDRDQWSRVTADLASDHTVILLDGPGHGRSTAPPEHYTLQDCADAAKTVLAFYSIPSADWVGNAWGGHVGLVFAHRYPAECRSLVAIGTPTIPLSANERFQTRALAAVYRRLGPNRLLGDAIADTLVSRRSRSADPQARQIVKDGFARAGRTGMHRSMHAMMLGRPDLADLLGQVSTPTLFLTGSLDKMWPPKAAAQHAATLPAGASAVVADASRLPPLEQPAEVLSELRRFWAQLPQAAPQAR